MLYVIICLLVVALFFCFVFAQHSGNVAKEMAEEAHNTGEYCIGLQMELGATKGELEVAKKELELLKAERANRLSTMYSPDYRHDVEMYMKENGNLSSAEIAKIWGIAPSTIRRWRRAMNKK